MSCRKLRVLGSGSYGTVFLGEPFSLFSGNPVFAVKSSELRCSDSLQVEALFLEELKGSGFIVRAFGDDISVENRKLMYNLLLEYAPGGTLKNLIDFRGGNIPEPEVSYYAYQLLRGIHDVHSRGIVHCDLKPDNVLLFPCKCGCGRNRLKIADFGLAKMAGKNNIFGDNHRGALMYTSPESLTHRMYEAPKDIWAVGCIVMEMITGKPIWNSIYNKDELKFNIASKKPEIPNDVSFLAKDFLDKCFESDPYSRRTAEVLLAHPFFADDEFSVCDHLGEEVKNPFGSRGWSSHTCLFSTRSFPVPEPSSDSYEFFRFLKMAMGGISTSSKPRPISTPNIYQRHLLPQFLNQVLVQ